MFKGIIAIYKKEIKAYFYSSIAYVFLILFILISNIIFFYFFGGIFKENSATMRRFFSILPYIFIIFIPGLTMGSWAKEKNAGTIELLFTFPITQMEILLGKFFATLSLVITALVYYSATTITVALISDLLSLLSFLIVFFGVIYKRGKGYDNQVSITN